MDNIYLALRWYSRKNFSKKLILNKKSADDKKHEMLPGVQKVNTVHNAVTIVVNCIYHIFLSDIFGQTSVHMASSLRTVQFMVNQTAALLLLCGSVRRRDPGQSLQLPS